MISNRQTKENRVEYIESMASDMNDDGEIDIVDLSIMNKKTLN